MTPCQHCSDTRWLGGVEGLGPCVCVTPEGMRELDDALHDEREAYEQRDGELRDAADALSVYLIRRGLSIKPVKPLDDPDLQQLVDILGL